MCTVSIVPSVDGWRVICNRDERRTRAAGRPPRLRLTERSWTAYPEDPVSGGTWVGVNGDGLVVALLNRTAPAAARRSAPRSRGTIVPRPARPIVHALWAYEALDLREYEPFRLVMVQRAAAVVGSRFLAGTRFALYVMSGVLRVPIAVFSLWALIAALLWTPTIVLLSATLGDAFVGRFTPLLGAGWIAKVGAATVAFGLLQAVRALASKQRRIRLQARVGRLLRWEFWPMCCSTARSASGCCTSRRGTAVFRR